VLVASEDGTKEFKDNLDLVANSGTICQISAPPQPYTHKLNHMQLFGQRKSVTGSLGGPTESIRELLELAAAKNIRHETQIIQGNDLNNFM
jgi:D-arabinose 1-dehydrogenase-like Zn-dependent alcohol dehydrogenase